MGNKNSTSKMKSSKQSAKVVPTPVPSATAAAAAAATAPSSSTSNTARQPATASTNGSNLPDIIPHTLLSTLTPLSGASAVYGQIWRFDPHTVLKRCGPSKTAEAAALFYVAQHTNIPVPRVLKTIPEEGFLFMEYIPGVSLDKVWDELTPSNKKTIIGQLKGYMAELSQVTGNWIGSVDKSQSNDQIFSSGTYGPFKDEEGFRKAIGTALRSYIETDEQDPTWVGQVVEFVESIPKGREIVLTHGDLVPRNILVNKCSQRGEGKHGGKGDGNGEEEKQDEWEVVAIVDWEMAGFYPAYWEYVKAHLFADYEAGWMKERVVDEVLPGKYALELGLLVHAKRIVLGF